MSEKVTTPVSRRSRPAKAALSREVIVESAMRLLDREGIDAVTMRRVAQELDTGPASLYVYIDNRDHLLALLLDRAMGEIELPPETAGDWRARALQLVQNGVETLTQRRGLAFISLATIPVGPNALAASEYMLSLLLAGGIDPATAAWGVDLIALYVNAFAAEQTMYLSRQEQGQTQAGYLAKVDEAFAALPPETFPHMLAMRSLLLAGSGEERFTWSIQVILNGLLATPPPAPSVSAAGED